MLIYKNAKICVGFQMQNVRVGYILLFVCVSISFALAPVFPVEYGLETCANCQVLTNQTQ